MDQNTQSRPSSGGDTPSRQNQGPRHSGGGNYGSGHHGNRRRRPRPHNPSAHGSVQQGAGVQSQSGSLPQGGGSLPQGGGSLPQGGGGGQPRRNPQQQGGQPRRAPQQQGGGDRQNQAYPQSRGNARPQEGQSQTPANQQPRPTQGDQARTSDRPPRPANTPGGAGRSDIPQQAGGQPRNDRPSRNWQERKVRIEETLDDVIKDNERIEKEIWLEIAEIHNMRID